LEQSCEVLSAAFTAEFIEASGRTGLEQSCEVLSAAFTAEFIEASPRTGLEIYF